MAFKMRRSTPRYRVKRAPRDSSGEETASVIANSILSPPPITTGVYENDGQSQPLMILSWVRDLPLTRTLLDGGSLLDLLNKRLMLKGQAKISSMNMIYCVTDPSNN